MATLTDRPAAPAPFWVGAMLEVAGLSRPSLAVRLPGRNESYRVDLDDLSVVVKRLQGPHQQERFARSIGHAATACPGPASPRLLHADHDLLALVFTTLPLATTGSDLLVAQTFTTGLCAEVGSAIGQLHSAPLVAVAELPTPAPSVPSEEALTALPLDLVSRFTAGEVKAWQLVQSDPHLPDYLRALRDGSAAAHRTPVHGDLRIDQVLVSGGLPYVVDWEEFGAGDPAYDTGSWIGEWVYRAVLDIPTARGDGQAIDRPDGVLNDTSLTERDIVRRGVAKLDALEPHITAFWNAYRAERPVTAEETARVTAFAGWHLLDRLLAQAHAMASLPGLHRAAAGIGKRILSNPGGAAEALGLAPSAHEAGAA